MAHIESLQKIGSDTWNYLRTTRQRSMIIVLALALLGYSIGRTSPASAVIFTGSTAPSSISEYSGGEYLSYFYLAGQADSWSSCNPVNCTTISRWIYVNWSIGGLSTFFGVVGWYDGGGAELCNGYEKWSEVDATPYYRYTIYEYLYYDYYCTVGKTAEWFWHGGMCDSSSDCLNSTHWAEGPHGYWYWNPQYTSSFTFKW